ncbi:MAG: hypothetical protein FIB02_12670 [Desulfuromonas sp.]|nr:hypothetical protein [Desulfuromonas sp.]
MKRLAWMTLILVVTLFCMGMGELGGQPEGTVPETDVRIEAKIVDRSGVETSLNQFSMDGKTYLDALRGSGQLTIPFQQLATLTCGKVAGDEMAVQVKLKSGSVMDLAIRKRAVFYGSTGYGAFVIKARDVAKIDFP